MEHDVLDFGGIQNNMKQAFFLPVHRHAAIPRQDLAARVLGAKPALVILQGGGGTGKSVTATQIVHHYLQQPDTAAVWVQLQPDTVGVEEVWQRVFTALDEANLVPEQSVASALSQGGLSTVTQEIITRGLAEVRGNVMVVLDDAHLGMDPDLEESIVFQLGCSQHLTIVLTTREKHPYLSSTSAQLRVPVVEVDGAGLALTAAEIATMLGERMPELNRLNCEQLANRIHQQSRGWVIAAHALVIEAVKHRELEASNTETPLQRSSFVIELVNRMLTRGSIEERKVLCGAALFSEISAEVLAKALYKDPKDIAKILETHEESNVEYRVDNEGVRWYRHHDLIQAELESRAEATFGTQFLTQFYSRAAHALEETRPYLAVRASIRGGQWQLLSDIMVHRNIVTLRRERLAVWLAEIPPTVRKDYPVLAAFALLDEYAFPTGRFKQVLMGFKMLAGPALSAEIRKEGLPGVIATTLRMVAARLTGREALAVEMAELTQRKLENITAEDYAKISQTLEVGMTQTAITHIHAGNMPAAEQVLGPILDNPRAAHHRNLAHASSLHAWTSAWRGDMKEAQRFTAQSAQLVMPLGWHDSYFGTGFRIAAAIEELERGNPEQAREHLDALAAHAATIEHWPVMAWVEATIAESQLGPAEALQVLEHQIGARKGRSVLLPNNKLLLHGLRARLLWLSGQVLPRSKSSMRKELPAVYEALSQGEFDIARALASSLAVTPRSIGYPRLRAEAILLLAEACRSSGDTHGATNAAQTAAVIMQNNDLVLPMRALPSQAAQELARLAPLLPVEHSSQGATRQVRSLTPAEHRALIAVIEQGSVAAGAAALFLSPETVKSYLKQVYRKLGVNNRADAIRVAGEAGLLNAEHSD